MSNQLWVDDAKPAPHGVELAQDYDTALARLLKGDIDVLYLDYDLGSPGCRGDVLLRELVEKGGLVPAVVKGISANPDGRRIVEQLAESLRTPRPVTNLEETMNSKDKRYTYGKSVCDEKNGWHVFRPGARSSDTCNCGNKLRMEYAADPLRGTDPRVTVNRLDDGWLEYVLDPKLPRSEVLVSSVRVRTNPAHAHIRVWNRGGSCHSAPMVVNAQDADAIVCRLMDLSPTELEKGRRELPPLDREVPVSR